MLAKKLLNSKCTLSVASVAIIASATQTIHMKSQELFRAFSHFLMRHPQKMQTTTPRSLAMIVNSYSKLEDFGENEKWEKLFREIKEVLLRNANGQRILDHCDSQALANLVNGYSKLKDFGKNEEWEELFHELKEVLLKKNSHGWRILDRCWSQELSNLVNGYSKLKGFGKNEEWKKLFREIKEVLLQEDSHGQRILDSCSNLALANLVNGYSKLKNFGESKEWDDLFLEIKDVLLRNANGQRILDRCESQQLDNLVNGYSKLHDFGKNEEWDDLFRKIEDLLLRDANGERILDHCDSQSLTSIVNGYLKLSFIYDDNGKSRKYLFHEISEALLRQDASGCCLVDICSDQSLANIASAFTCLSPCLDRDDLHRLFSRILSRCTRDFCEECSLISVMSLVRSFTMKKLIDDPARFSQLIQSLLDRLEGGEVTANEDLRQLHQIEHACRYKLGAAWNDRDVQRLTGYLRATKRPIISDAYFSTLHMAVFDIVRKMYPDALSEVAIENMPVDILLPRSMTVIEVNGPCHYLGTSQGPVLNFRTSFKQALLQAMGFPVIEVKYDEWDALNGKPEAEKREFIRKRLVSSRIGQF
jgi:hypothetical protein